MAKKFTASENKRQEYFKKVFDYLTECGEEAMQVGTNELTFPVVDSEGNGIFLNVLVKLPGTRAGVVYDGYDDHANYEFELAEKKKKEEKDKEEKKKKMERDKKKREQSEKIKAKMQNKEKA